VTLVSKSNGYQQGADATLPYSCVDLVSSYAQQLKFTVPAGSMPSGIKAAEGFASTSNGQFTYNSGPTASAPPMIGSVVSFGAMSNDPDGHVAVVQGVAPNGPNSVTVTLFDQNWPYEHPHWTTADFTKNADGVWSGTLHDSATIAPQGVAVGWANPN
jgi:hypothetical protein